MERTRLLNELVRIDAVILEATSRATGTRDDVNFELVIEEIRELRKQRAAIQAKLDALSQ
jgi:hypothetical protein